MPGFTAEGHRQNWSERLQRLILALEQKHQPSIVLIDSRAGIDEVASACVTDLGAQRIYLFAVDSWQTWKGLRCNLEVSGGTAGMTADLRREAAGGPSVATAAKPVDDGGARLLVEDDELEGAAVVAVLLSPDGRVIAQRRTVVGGQA
jgi:hypothetical protein